MFLPLLVDSFVLSVLLAVLIMIFIMSRRTIKYPPGPKGFPLIGSIPLLSKGRSSEVFMDLSKQYGDVFSIQLGQYYFVVLNGYETIRDALVKNGDLFCNRAQMYIPEKITLSYHGISRASGKHWRQTRQFSLQALRGFGFGKQSIESKIRFELEDERFQKLLGLIDEGFFLLGNTNIGLLLPVLRFLPGDIFNIKKTIGVFQKLSEFMAEIIKEHELSYSEDNIRDFVDAFIKERNIQQSQGKQDSTFTDVNLCTTVLDFFTAGSETSVTTILWFLLHILHHKDVQEKMYEEVVEVIGVSRKPRLSDQPLMPYFHAVLTEVFRIKNIAPLGIQYGTMEDIQFKGYTIPKGSIIITNFDSVAFDPKEFEEPKRFDPSRFIDEHGQLINHPKVIPFSIGRRACMGESLARNELFLFLTSLIQRFEFLPENEADLPSLEGIDGITHSPRPFTLKAVERK